MKRVTSIVAGLLGVVLIGTGGIATTLQAQDAPGEIFTVPFAFTAGGHVNEPGTYEVRREANPFLISIQNVQTGDKQLSSVRPEEKGAAPAKGLLVFRKCGDHKDLSEFHIRAARLFSMTIEARGRKNSEMEVCSSTDTTMLAAR